MNEKENKKFEAILDLVVNLAGKNPVYNSILLVNIKNRYKYLGSSGCVYPGGQQINAYSDFRIASITKTFTATIILQLMEEGLLQLKDKFLHFIERSKWSFLKDIHCREESNFTSSIGIHHLLQHTSGLRDYFTDDKRFIDFIDKNQSLQWNADLILIKYFGYDLNKKALFKPGDGFYYSDTNYVLLAILIEELTGKTLHEAFEERIFKPLELSHTYLEFYQLPKADSTRTYPLNGDVSLKEVNTSFDWGGGGLVSTVSDLDIFSRHLLKGHLFKQRTTVETMINFSSPDLIKPQEGSINYGLGLQKKEIRDKLFIGHTGAYGCMMYYNIIEETSIILTINQAAAMQKAEWLLRKAAEILEELEY